MGGEGFEGGLFLRIEAGAGGVAALERVEERHHVGRDEKLRVGERVHQEHFAAIRERDADIEHGRLHIRPLSFYWRNGCGPAVQGPFPGLD
jgi:hypothetical protein